MHICINIFQLEEMKSHKVTHIYNPSHNTNTKEVVVVMIV
jgi:hypothetical protein